MNYTSLAAEQQASTTTNVHCHKMHPVATSKITWTHVTLAAVRTGTPARNTALSPSTNCCHRTSHQAVSCRPDRQAAWQQRAHCMSVTYSCVISAYKQTKDSCCWCITFSSHIARQKGCKLHTSLSCWCGTLSSHIAPHANYANSRPQQPTALLSMSSEALWPHQ